VAKFIVCPTCEGNGVITNPEIVGNGYTQDEIEDMGEEFLDNLREGVYDVTCPECDGKRVSTQAEHNAFLRQASEDWQDRKIQLAEMGIYPGSRDYF
jgi:predicted methyltransferase